MAKRSRKSISIGWLLLVMLVACVGAAAVSYYSTGNDDGVRTPHKKPVIYKRPAITPAPHAPKTTIYLADVRNGKPYLRPVVAEVREDSQPGKLNQAMEALIAEGQNDDEGELIPKGTRLLSPVRVRGSMAVVNLSHEFVDNFPGGLAQERLTLNCIAFTLVENGDGRVGKIMIVVEGETVESLGGHYSLDEPIEPDPKSLCPQ